MAATVHDVAAFILRERGRPTSTIMLQKLVYYAQAWSLAWDGRALFGERIEAWKLGPIAPALWRTHKGVPTVASLPTGDPSTLTSSERDTVRAVLGFYGDRDPWWLSELSHREAPWRDARGELPTDAPGSVEIEHDAMRAYYRRFGIARKSFPEALGRGLDLLVCTPLDAVSALLDETTEQAHDLEEWLMTGEGNPWESSTG